MKYIRRTRTLNKHEQSAYKLTENREQVQGLPQGPLCIYSFQISVFMAILSLRVSVSLILVVSLGFISFFDCCFQFHCDFLSYIFCFVMFGYLFEACSFIMRDCKRVDSYGSQGG